MTTRFRHFTFGLLVLACAAFISSCSTEDTGQTLIVKFDDTYQPKAVELSQDDTTKPVTAKNAKTATFNVVAAVTYKGKRTLEYIWEIDSSDISVGYSIAPDTSFPSRATITLTYGFPLAGTVFDGAMPIKLLVKEKDGPIQASDSISVKVYVYGSSNG
jgi:hypothetical protein